jgi:hypothetical protein
MNPISRRTHTFLLMLLLSLPSASRAQATNVYVVARSEDEVGTRFVFVLKEAIRRSAAFRLVDRQADTVLTLHLVTMETPSESRGSATSYSVTWTFRTSHETKTPISVYMASTVGSCGRSRVEECAHGVLADTDQQATKARDWQRQLRVLPNK